MPDEYDDLLDLLDDDYDVSFYIDDDDFEYDDERDYEIYRDRNWDHLI